MSELLAFVAGVFLELRHECVMRNLAEFFSTIKNGLENSKYPLSHWFLCTTRKPMFGTEGRNRTGTKSPSPDFESEQVKKHQHATTNKNN